MTRSEQEIRLERRARLKSPRAAAIAGILFSVLFTTSLVLIRMAFPDTINSPDAAVQLQEYSGWITLALGLVPFAGIAFLWFMGVVRDRIGEMEDQFFSTIFYGSGLLFLAMIFVSAAIAGGMLATYATLEDPAVRSGVIQFGRAMTFTITNIYAIRMAGVFMISVATIWSRTHVMPRLFVFLTYGLALLMLIAINLTVWLALVFPVWVFVISVYILLITFRAQKVRAEGVLGASES